MTILALYTKPNGVLKDAYGIHTSHLRDVYLRGRGSNTLVFSSHDAKELLAVPLENVVRVEYEASLRTEGDLSAIIVEAEHYAYSPPIEITLDETDGMIYIVKYYTDDLEVSETIAIHLDTSEGDE